MEKTLSRDLTQGNVFKQLILFALPIMFANVLQIVYTIVDTVVVGHFIGTAGISAVSSAGNIIMLFTNFSMGISSAGQVIISQYQGKNDKESVNRSIGTMFTFVVVVALILTVISIPCARALLNLVNTPAEAMDGAMSYAICSFCGLIFIFGYSSVGAMLRGLGDSRHPLVFIAIATGINIILDILFVGFFNMGTLGAALATIIAQGVSFVFSIGYLYKHRVGFGFDFKPASFRPDPNLLKLFVKLGFPMALQHVAVNISVMYVSACVNSYGVVVSALSGIGDKLRMIIATFAASIGTAGAAMIGQNVGAGKLNRVKRIYLVELAVLLVLCTALGLVCLAFPKAIIGMFDTNPEVLSMAPRYMVINLVMYISFAFYQPFNSLIHGMGNARFALINGMVDGLVARVGLVWLLGTALGIGYWGVWWGGCLASYVGATIGNIYFFSGLWKRYKSFSK